MTEIRNLTELMVLDYGYFIPVQLADGTTKKISLYTLLGVTPPPTLTTLLSLDFEGANNSAVFTDSSSFARVATVFGDAKLSTTAPIVGVSSGLFDGVGDYITFPGSADFDFSLFDFKIALQIKTSQSGNYKALITRGDVSQYAGNWGIFNHNGQIQCWQSDFSVGAPVLDSGAVNVSDGNPHSIEWRRTAITQELSIDNVVVGSSTTIASFGASSEPVCVGADLNVAGREYSGAIDALSIARV